MPIQFPMVLEGFINGPDTPYIWCKMQAVGKSIAPVAMEMRILKARGFYSMRKTFGGGVVLKGGGGGQKCEKHKGACQFIFCEVEIIVARRLFIAGTNG